MNRRTWKLRTWKPLAVRLVGAALLFGGVTAAVVARGVAAPAKLTLTWHGQACFVLQSPSGTRVVMDPIPGEIGYTPPGDIAADAITISHEHQDHNNVALVKGKPKILRGLTEDKKGWTSVKAKVKDVSIRSVGVYHDPNQGKDRGLNAVFVFEAAGQRIAHLGDLGHELTDQQLKEIGPVDVVLVPVGGTYTIDAAGATRVIEQLRPSTIVIPMHYKTDVLKIPLATVDAFLAGKATVRRETGNVLELGPGRGSAKGKGKAKGKSKDEAGAAGGPEIVVLNYK